MDTKIRKQIYLDPQQNEYLKQASRDLGISEAEIIRQALTAQAQRLKSPGRSLSAWERELKFLKQLQEQAPMPGKRTWKRNDLYE